MFVLELVILMWRPCVSVKVTIGKSTAKKKFWRRYQPHTRHYALHRRVLRRKIRRPIRDPVWNWFRTQTWNRIRRVPIVQSSICPEMQTEIARNFPLCPEMQAVMARKLQRAKFRTKIPRNYNVPDFPEMISNFYFNLDGTAPSYEDRAEAPVKISVLDAFCVNIDPLKQFRSLRRIQTCSFLQTTSARKRRMRYNDAMKEGMKCS